ncbi:MAG: 7-cyano-7-deazaguanine synthase [Chloroflexota bacterium]|nr:7-cyano-7-deazaguanine synthase [Chloroflexota bacterium]
MTRENAIAVLASGGLDSCALLADLTRSHEVFPLYVRQGLAWEEAERAALDRFVGAVASPNLHPVTTIPLPVEAMYGRHWSVTGEGVPAATDPDEKVYLPGRNVLLLAAAGVWCAVNGVRRVAMGTLGGNPFPDATSEFFADYARLLTTAMSHPIEVVTPYREMRKHELIVRSADFPLHLTLTCNAPRGGQHCGACNKCYERRSAFARAGVEDKTAYTA